MNLLRLPMLDPRPDAAFPDPAQALAEPDGLLAFGGDLSPQRLLGAYRSGIFPWYSAGQPILWWSPDPRSVVDPAQLQISRRNRRQLRGKPWTLRADGAFDAVVAACASIPRPGQHGTWITAEMRQAYGELHRRGHAHSVEVLEDNRLIGGIYGVAIGRAFFGESMFGRQSGASRAAIAGLARQLAAWDFRLLDGQVESAHLATLGFERISRQVFLQRCRAACEEAPAVSGNWSTAFGAPSIDDLFGPHPAGTATTPASSGPGQDHG